MQTTFDTACRILPTLSTDELRRLQARIVDMLRDSDGQGHDILSDDGLTNTTLSSAQLEAELDDAIAEFDHGEGYPAEEMSMRIKAQFGW